MTHSNAPGSFYLVVTKKPENEPYTLIKNTKFGMTSGLQQMKDFHINFEVIQKAEDAPKDLRFTVNLNSDSTHING